MKFPENLKKKMQINPHFHPPLGKRKEQADVFFLKKKEKAPDKSYKSKMVLKTLWHFCLFSSSFHRPLQWSRVLKGSLNAETVISAPKSLSIKIMKRKKRHGLMTGRSVRSWDWSSLLNNHYCMHVVEKNVG